MAAESSPMPRQIGRFRLIRRLGSGGFGVVFLAEDPVLQRLVAVKIPRPETLATPDLQRRFVQESQLAARLTHPHLVAIHEAGQAGPVSYQVTAYCAGGNLSQWLRSASGGCQSSDGEPHDKSGDLHSPLGVASRLGTSPTQRQLSVKVAIELLIALADGVQHAHEHGILHRDLKPSNILLQPRSDWSGVADRSIDIHNLPLEKLWTKLQPMISDFGLAKMFVDLEAVSPPSAARQSSELQFTTMAGTPQYMAPEQFARNGDNIGPATDVYALGAILYEVLAGCPVFPKSVIDILRIQVAESRPKSLRERRPEVPRDLDAICLKCLAKPVSERYASAKALADDIRAFSRGDAVAARPWPWHEQLAKWSQRRPAVASLLLFSGLLMLGLVSFGAWHLTQLNSLNDQLRATVHELETQTVSAKQQTQRANQQAQIAGEKEVLAVLHSRRTEDLAWIARRSAYSANLLRAAERFQQGQIPAMGGILQEQQPLRGEGEFRGFEWHYLWSLGRNRREFQGHTTAPICAASLTPDGGACFAISCDGTIRRWDALTGVLQQTWSLPGEERVYAEINRDVTRAILHRREEPMSVVFAWDLQRGQELRRHEFSEHEVADVAIAPDGTWGLIGGQTDGLMPSPVLLWSIESGSMTQVNVPESFDRPSYGVSAVAISPDGQECAVASHSTSDTLSWHHQLFRSTVRFDAVDDETPGIARSEHTPGIAEWECLKPPSMGLEMDLAYSPDGDEIALSILHDQKGRAEVWGRNPSRLKNAIDDDMRKFDKLAFDPSGQTLALSTMVTERPSDSNPDITDAAVSMTSRSEFTFWNVGEETHHPASFSTPEQITSIDFHVHSKAWVIGKNYGGLSLWRPETVAQYRELPGHQPQEAWGVAFSPDSQSIYTVGDDSLLRAWNVESGLQTGSGEHHTSLVSCLAVSPDGRWIATGSYDEDVVLWNAASMSVQAVLKGHAHDIRCVAFSADSKTVASAGRDQSIRRWSVPDGRLLSVYDQQGGTIRSAIFIGNQRLIEGNADGQIRICTPDGLSELLRDEVSGEEILCAAIAPVGLKWPLNADVELPLNEAMVQTASANELILYGCKFGALRLLHIPTQQVLLEKYLDTDEIRSVRFFPRRTNVRDCRN